MTANPSAFRVRGSLRVLWRPAVLYAGLGAVLSGAVVGSSTIGSNAVIFDSFWDALRDFFGLWILSTGVLSAITIPWWFWYAGRTSYVVDEGRLKMLVGAKTVQAWPLGSIFVVRLDPGPAWIDLLTPFNIDGGVFPRITFRTEVPVDGRPVLLWGHDATQQAERELLAAIAASKGGAPSPRSPNTPSSGSVRPTLRVVSEVEPQTRPLGLLAVGVAIVSVALSVTYFLSPYAIAVAVVALLLGAVSRTDPATRRLGSVAILLAVAAIGVSCAVLLWI